MDVRRALGPLIPLSTGLHIDAETTVASIIGRQGLVTILSLNYTSSCLYCHVLDDCILAVYGEVYSRRAVEFHFTRTALFPKLGPWQSRRLGKGRARNRSAGSRPLQCSRNLRLPETAVLLTAAVGQACNSQASCHSSCSSSLPVGIYHPIDGRNV